MILLASMTRTYALTLIYPPETDVTDKNAPVMIKKLVGEGVTITEVIVTGKKPLVYPIKKHTEGIYVSATVGAPKLNVPEMEKRIKLGAEVIRFLLTVK
jgi:small subunit ribosomal protein S6